MFAQNTSRPSIDCLVLAYINTGSGSRGCGHDGGHGGCTGCGGRGRDHGGHFEVDQTLLYTLWEI